MKTSFNHSYFIADTHFGHANIIKFCNRPFVSAEEMDETLVENWNSIVKKNDTIYHLGDFSFDKLDKKIETVKRLNGYKILIKGNHDSNNKTFLKEWDEVYNYLEIKIEKIKYKMIHYPMLEWASGVNIHGHSHGTSVRKHKRVDVGIDSVGYFPIHFEEMRDIALGNSDPLYPSSTRSI